MSLSGMATKTSLFVMMLAFLALAAGIATAVNAHGGDAAQIHSCVNDNSGEIKIIGEDDNCKKNQTALDWNVVGIQGPQGIQGETGAKGDKGDKGDTGAKGDKGDQGDPGVPSQYPATLAMDSATTAGISIGSITVDGEKVLGPVAPSQNVTIKFNWSIASAGTIIQQVVVGFAGQSYSRCIHSATGAASGTASVVLPAPATTGPAVVTVHRHWQYNCTDNHAHQHPVPAGNSWLGVSANPPGNSYIAVVAVK